MVRAKGATHKEAEHFSATSELLPVQAANV